MIRKKSIIHSSSPVVPSIPGFLHGGDYNPDQWLDYPEILKEDLRLMKVAGWNVVSLGIFAWTALEPREGRYEFGWLDKLMDSLWANGISIILATPSGARPAWLAQKYPEVLRVNADRTRILWGDRHNHCYTSPLYRRKVGAINQALARRYGKHPGLVMWHVSNEYGGECHCPLCQKAFRAWLKRKYQNDLKSLNHAWWTSFWSHTFTDWSQIESPSPHGDHSLHGLALDWKRFVTDQSVDFYRAEVKALRTWAPDIPVTTNFMGTYPGLNYWKFKDDVDVVAWDSYPAWHQNQEDWRIAAQAAFIHDLNRSLGGGKPFLMLESTPSVTNWQAASKLKRPGMHLLSSLQAVAHGSDSVMYFQWRKGRGGVEKFHGAVVGHDGSQETRVFRDVQAVAQALDKLKEARGSRVEAKVGLVFDWENRWALEGLAGLRRDRLDYEPECLRHYQPLWQMGLAADVIDMGEDFSKYRLLIAPMLYLLKPGVTERLERFVQNGGTLVSTYVSGWVDENDLCYQGASPLSKLLGLQSEETDTLCEGDENSLAFKSLNPLGMRGRYKLHTYCDLIHTQSAEVLASYQADFYQGRAAFTVNKFGKGKAYYLAARAEERFYTDFYQALAKSLNLEAPLVCALPKGLVVRSRRTSTNEYIFLMNFTATTRQIHLGRLKLKPMLGGAIHGGDLRLPPYGIEVLRRPVADWGKKE